MSESFADYGIDVRGSGEVQTLCPKCSHTRKKDRVKCLSVNTDEGVWFCHHCEWTGKLKGMGGPVVGLKPPNKKVKKNNLELNEKAKKFLIEDRGINEEVLKRNAVGFDGEAITFPFFRDGEIVNIKSRGPGKKFHMERGGEIIPYGFDDIAETTIICEGELDKLSLEVAGFQNAISVPNGSRNIEFLKNCEHALSDTKKFIIAVDNDEPGQKLEKELIRRLGAGLCWRVEWPEECKDANDVLTRQGPDELRKCIDTAKPLPVEGICYASDLELEEYYLQGDEDGVSLGWFSMDRHLLLCKETGQLNVVTGIPGHGKSEFMDAVMVNLAKAQGWKWGLFSPENFPYEYHVSKIAEKYLGLPFRDGFQKRMNVEDVRASKQWINDRFFFMAPDEDSLDVRSILTLARTLVFRHGIKGLIIDPWNELSHERPAALSETEYISMCLTKFRRFARMNNVHVFLVAHPQKLQKSESGKYPVPRPYDISGSAHWFNKSDNCFTVWRDWEDDSNEVLIHVQKVKKKHLGTLGVVALRYDYSTGRYLEDV